MDAITVIGAGGIGCAVGYALLKAGCNVQFVDADAAKVEAGNRTGVGVAGRVNLGARFVLFDCWHPDAHHLHLLCTKCYDNADVLARLSADAMILPVQNGFDDELESRTHIAEGIASFVSECATGRPETRITRKGDLHFGGRGVALPDWLVVLARQLQEAGLFRTACVEDICPIKHSKLLYNAAISPLAAVAGLDNAQLLQLPRARRLFFSFLQENHAILTAASKPLGRVGPFHPDRVMSILSRPWLARVMARWFARGLRGTYCSMAGDIEKGRTEVQNYNGQLARWAGRTPCPLNRRAITIVERMSSERIRPNLSMLDQFESAPISAAAF